jgi:hypothetical protein
VADFVVPAEAGTQGTLDTGFRRCDGGPSTGQAAIALEFYREFYREFLLELAGKGEFVENGLNR